MDRRRLRFFGGVPLLAGGGMGMDCVGLAGENDREFDRLSLLSSANLLDQCSAAGGETSLDSLNCNSFLLQDNGEGEVLGE